MSKKSKFNYCSHGMIANCPHCMALRIVELTQRAEQAEAAGVGYSQETVDALQKMVATEKKAREMADVEIAALKRDIEWHLTIASNAMYERDVMGIDRDRVRCAADELLETAHDMYSYANDAWGWKHGEEWRAELDKAKAIIMPERMDRCVWKESEAV